MVIGVIINQTIKDLRIKSGVTLEQLAEYTGMDVLILKAYEEGSLNPTYEDLQKLAEFHKCSVDFILGIEGNPDIKVLGDDELPDILRENGITQIAINANSDISDIDSVALLEFIKSVEKNDNLN